MIIFGFAVDRLKVVCNSVSAKIFMSFCQKKEAFIMIFSTYQGATRKSRTKSKEKSQEQTYFAVIISLYVYYPRSYEKYKNVINQKHLL